MQTATYPFSRLRRSLLTRLILLLSVFLVLLALGFYNLSRLAEGNQIDNRALNVAGRQRTLAERYARQTNLALVALAAGDIGALVEQRKAAEKTSASFRETLQALLRGGTVSIGERSYRVQALINPTVRTTLQQIERDWDDLERRAVLALRTDHTWIKGNENLASIQRSTVDMVDRMDQMVNVLHQESEANLQTLMRYQMLFGSAGVGLFLVVLMFVCANIITPLGEKIEQLYASDERFDLAARAANDGIWDWNLRTGAVYYSPRFQELLGYGSGELEASIAAFEQRIHPEDRPMVTACHERHIENGHPYAIEFRLQMPFGEHRWFQGCGQATRDREGRPARLVGSISDITERKQAEMEREELHQQLVRASRQAGMAEVATGVLHNVGNVLNSVNVSATLVMDIVRRSKVAGLSKAIQLLSEHNHDMESFLTEDEKGRQLPGYLCMVTSAMETERQTILNELQQLTKSIDHIKDIVSTQQTYAGAYNVIEAAALADLIEDALRMNAAAFSRHDVCVVKEFENVPRICVDKHKILQILMNLLSNAKYAMDGVTHQAKTLTIQIARHEETHVRLSVRDNGVGISAENLARIFAHGFTTRTGGHGFGLHSSSLAAKEMGGLLTAHSDGPGKGTIFTLELPALSSR